MFIFLRRRERSLEGFEEKNKFFIKIDGKLGRFGYRYVCDCGRGKRR